MKIPLLILAGLGAAAPPAAAAPTLAPLKACYVSIGVDERTGETLSETVNLRGSGFTPDARVQILVDGTIAADDVSAGSDGSLRAAVRAPLQEQGQRAFQITATEKDNTANSATIGSRVTVMKVTVRPRRATPRKRVTFSGRGFTNRRRPVFAHYVRGGKVRRTVRLVKRPKGACGTFRVRRPQFPFSRPRTGRWVLRLDQSRRYRVTPPGPFYELEIFVRRVLRLGSRAG